MNSFFLSLFDKKKQQEIKRETQVSRRTLEDTKNNKYLVSLKQRFLHINDILLSVYLFTRSPVI